MESPKPVPILKLNDSYASYKELRLAVERYEKINRVQFWIRDAKRLHRASPSIYQIVKDHPELEYCSLKLSCIHGGKAFQQKQDFFLKPARKSRGTFKQNCKAEIFVKLNDEKNRLVITRFEEKHNHDIPTAEFFKNLPKVRRSAEQRRVSINRQLQQEFPETEGIRLDNIIKANSLSRSKNFEKIAELLKEQFHCTVDLQHDENGKIYGFFFQDDYMKKCFELFPEILLADGSYKLENIKCSIYTISVENSMGSKSIVGVGVLTVEDKESFDWLLERFKDRNPKSTDVTIIITDRQSCEYKISTHFPNADVLICTAHAVYTFKKDLAKKQILNITASERTVCLLNFIRLTQAPSEDEYTAILEDIDDDMPYPLTEYFYKHWHQLRHLWVKGLSNVRSFIDSKLEDPNSRYRSNISGCKTFRKFLEELFTTLHFQRISFKNTCNEMSMKVFEQQNDAARSYDKTLTPFASEKIINDLNLVEEGVTKFRFKTTDSDVLCQTKNSKQQFVVSEYSCVCGFFTILKLPCKHVLAYRKTQKLSLFDECLFSQRWTRRYLKNLLEIDIPLPEIVEKTCEEKFVEAESICLGLAALCSEVADDEFRERKELLMQLKRSWENEDKMVLETREFAKKTRTVESDYESPDDTIPEVT